MSEEFNKTIASLREQGELLFFGRVGNQHELCVYTHTIGGLKYQLLVNLDGTVVSKKQI